MGVGPLVRCAANAGARSGSKASMRASIPATRDAKSPNCAIDALPVRDTSGPHLGKRQVPVPRYFRPPLLTLTKGLMVNMENVALHLETLSFLLLRQEVQLN